jgi:hypothetical protein
VQKEGVKPRDGSEGIEFEWGSKAHDDEPTAFGHIGEKEDTFNVGMDEEPGNDSDFGWGKAEERPERAEPPTPEPIEEEQWSLQPRKPGDSNSPEKDLGWYQEEEEEVEERPHFGSGPSKPVNPNHVHVDKTTDDSAYSMNHNREDQMTEKVTEAYNMNHNVEN